MKKKTLKIKQRKVKIMLYFNRTGCYSYAYQGGWVKIFDRASIQTQCHAILPKYNTNTIASVSLASSDLQL